jgi:hypothetical protein
MNLIVFDYQLIERIIVHYIITNILCTKKFEKKYRFFFGNYR